MMHLTTLWFVLIAVLWTGYFVLEGFDFGVGMLLPVLGRTPEDRLRMYRSLGPVWDGNEVWLLVAGGATFAAFPEWYATMFSGFYLPLLLILVALIVRGTAIEYRNKRPDAQWQHRWDLAMTASSALPALLWGVAFANIVRGVPLDSDHVFTGTLFSLLNPYALLGGVVTLVLFSVHGAVFLALKTDGDLRARARVVVVGLGALGAVGGVVFLLLTQALYGRAATDLPAGLVAAALIGAIALTRRERDGWAFVASAAMLLLVVATLFGDLWPKVLPAHVAANSLTVYNASSSPYTLGVMSWVAIVMTPIVLAYQAWSYWVFRERVTGTPIPSLPLQRDAPELEREPVTR